MSTEAIKIARITQEVVSDKEGSHFCFCWIQNGVTSIEIDARSYQNVSNSIFLLNPRHSWKIHKQHDGNSSGYLLYLPKEVLDHPLISKLHISEVQLFAAEEIPKINLAPGIEKRIEVILEMIDELIGSHLNHKEDALLSLLHTFFVYCDGQCNIKSIMAENNAKKALVYQFKRLVNQKFSEFHEVADYAQSLNVSNKYLNQCVKEVLGVNAKKVITEQRIMRSRHELKFSDKSIKEICFSLGFSSPDYFSYFFKKHTGLCPSALRQA
ncbi:MULTISPECIES: AraC family transcriptional regulator [Arenibacter]|uniref:AraC family transcriptional regulator n=1 Tax=Arenibacter TaxID=178469 RepID=UPI000A3C4F26|nr:MULTISPECIES: helix-turn-helix domain-containing protein [Arenibacter]